MLADRIWQINDATKKVFSGEIVAGVNEPNAKNTHESYILKAMWVMMVAEFEGSIKQAVEDYLDKVKTLEISKIHPCILLQSFGLPKGEKQENTPTPTQIMSLYKDRIPEDINYVKFTRNKIVRQNQAAITELFHTLGVLFSDPEEKLLKKLEKINNKRNSIAHGDTEVQITAVELNEALDDVLEIYEMLENKLSVSL